MFEWNGVLAVKIQKNPKDAVELQVFKGRKKGRKDDKQQANKQQATEKEVR